MRIVIYNSSSFGGCYDYGREMLKAYQQLPEVVSAEWWVPVNALDEGLIGQRRIMLNDKPGKNRLLRQLHFLWRNLMNPMLMYLRLAAAPDSFVILNDFEQLSAPLWAPIFKRSFAGRHRFAVILHDPDRDAYPPSLRWTNYSMKSLIRLNNLAFYHSFLPDKDYYRNAGDCRFYDLPHGVFHLPAPDPECLNIIQKNNSEGRKILSIPGNIRQEKNYHLAIEALKDLPGCTLLIAGAASNARVNVSAYRKIAEQLGVEDRVIWLEKYLSRAELAAVIFASDVVLLNYAGSFTSQSGIFNVTIPFRKPVVVSAGKSGMNSVVESFGLGTITTGQEAQHLVKAVERALMTGESKANWEDYQQIASWENNARLGLHYFQQL